MRHTGVQSAVLHRLQRQLLGLPGLCSDTVSMHDNRMQGTACLPCCQIFCSLMCAAPKSMVADHRSLHNWRLHCLPLGLPTLCNECVQLLQEIKRYRAKSLPAWHLRSFLMGLPPFHNHSRNAEGRASPAWRLLSLLLALPDLLSCATAARCSFLMTLFLRAATALACSVPGPKLWLLPSVCGWLQWDTSVLATKGMSR